MNYIDDRHIRAYQGMIAADLRSSRGHGRHGPLAGLRRMVASTLVLTGARLLPDTPPDTPAMVGDRVLVYRRRPITEADRKLQPAA